jgi:hypothetical protein
MVDRQGGKVKAGASRGLAEAGGVRAIGGSGLWRAKV